MLDGRARAGRGDRRRARGARGRPAGVARARRRPGQPGARRAAAAAGERVRPRRWSDRALEVDTPAGLARALLDAPQGEAARAPSATRGGPALQPAAAALDACHHLGVAAGARAQADPQRPHVYLREDDGPARRRDLRPAASPRPPRWRAACASDGVRRGRHGRADAAHRLRLPARVPGHPDRGRRAGADLPAGAPRPARGVRATARRAILADAEVRALVTIDRARGVAGAAQARGAVAHARDDRRRPGRPRKRRPGEPEGKRRRSRVHPVHVGQHGPPKGVLLTHDNLLANIRAIGRRPAACSPPTSA